MRHIAPAGLGLPFRSAEGVRLSKVHHRDRRRSQHCDERRSGLPLAYQENRSNPLLVKDVQSGDSLGDRMPIPLLKLSVGSLVQAAQ